VRIDNHTHWRTDHLRAFAVRVAQEELDPGKRRRFVLTVTYGHRGPGVSGSASYNSVQATICVGSDEVDKANLAHTIAHEMAHTRGMRHPAMRGSRRYSYVEGWQNFYSWANELPLERKLKPVRPAKKTTDVDGMVAKWHRRLKLARTMLRKWERRQRRLRARIGKAAGATTPKKEEAV
jgi:hypothetical protein